MTSDNDAPAVPVRVDAYDADWMIVTVDGVRLTAAPVRRDELEQTLQELTTRMGRPPSSRSVSTTAPPTQGY